MNDKLDGHMEIEEGAFCPIPTPLIGRREHEGRPCTDLYVSGDPKEISQEDTRG
ncbi:MAG: hypothetical protein AAB523_02380 [Patescibacteria group bacterium]